MVKKALKAGAKSKLVVRRLSVDRNEVSTAFEIVLEEIESVAENLNAEGSSAFQKGDYEATKSLIEVATQLSEFRSRVRTLQKEWETVLSTRVPRSQLARRRRKTALRLPRGLRTTEDNFRQPIMEALHALGGKASMSKVLDTVEEKMKDILNDYDYQKLSSYPYTVRWRNTAQWCRNTLVQEGLLKADSERGIWELADR